MPATTRVIAGTAFAAIASLSIGACDKLRREDPGKAAAEARRQQAACASPSANDKLKGLIFDQAISKRQSDRESLDTLADYSVARMEEPVVKGWDPALDITRCQARFILEVPPGAEHALGGQRRLTADIDYSAQASADGSGFVYRAKGAEPIVAKLAQFNLNPLAYRPPPAFDEPQQSHQQVAHDYYAPPTPGPPPQSQASRELPQRTTPPVQPRALPRVEVTERAPTAPVQQPSVQSRPTSGEATVRAFYSALGRGNGVSASSQIIPEKRSTRAFSAEGISNFYGRLKEPLRLTSIKAVPGGAYHVTYRYSAGRSRCDGSALVSVTQRGGRQFIRSIQSLSGC